MLIERFQAFDSQAFFHRHPFARESLSTDPPQQLGFDLEAYASGSCTCNISILHQEDESTGTVTPPEEILPPVKAPELDCSAFLHAVPWNRIASDPCSIF